VHLSFDLYLMVLRGELPPAVLAEVAHRHLLDLCSECADNWELYQRGHGAPFPIAAGEGVGDPRHRPAFGAAARRVEQAEQDSRQERRRARHDLKVLLASPPAGWPARVARAQRRFRSRGFAELLLAEARRRFASEPAVAARLAGLVPEVVHWIPGAGEGWRQDLRSLAAAYVANVQRIQGDLDAADREFRRLRGRLARHPATEAAVHAEIDSLEASLRLDQRRLDDAALLLDRAVLVQSTTRARDLLAGLLLQRASLSRMRQEYEVAERDLARAAGLIGEESGLFPMAVGSRALTLCDLGRLDEAEGLLAEHRERFAAADAWTRLLRRGIEGRIALGRRQLTAAEEAFVEVRDGALELERPYDAALAALDLAEVYLAEARLEELAALAAGLVPAFEARGVSREALAALALLQQAVAAREVSLPLLAEVRRQVRWAR
jgi:hypothetical protein